MQADALIIGGGPAGLGAALSLARLRKRTILLSSGKFRNESADVMHNVIGFDGEPPSKYRAEALQELQPYDTTTIVDHEAVNVEKTDQGFTIDGKFSGTILIIASGVRDELEDIPGRKSNLPGLILVCAMALFGREPTAHTHWSQRLHCIAAGLEALWGKTVVHCPFCHGTEHADQAGAVLGLTQLGIKMAGWFSITKNLQLLTNGTPVTQVLLCSCRSYDVWGSGYKQLFAYCIVQA